MAKSNKKGCQSRALCNRLDPRDRSRIPFTFAAVKLVGLESSKRMVFRAVLKPQGGTLVSRQVGLNLTNLSNRIMLRATFPDRDAAQEVPKMIVIIAISFFVILVATLTVYLRRIRPDSTGDRELAPSRFKGLFADQVSALQPAELENSTYTSA